MEKNILNKFWLNNYLSNSDLIYKYSLKSIHNIPKITHINLSFSLDTNSINKGNNISLKTIRNLYLFLFSVFYSLPQIKTKVLPSAQGSQKNSNSQIFFKHKFSTVSQKDFFFFLFFVECWQLYLKQGFNLEINQPFLIQKTKLLTCLKAHLPLSILPNYDFFHDFSNNSSFKDDASIFIVFNFNNLIGISKKNCVKNLPLFWKN